MLMPTGEPAPSAALTLPAVAGSLMACAPLPVMSELTRSRSAVPCGMPESDVQPNIRASFVASSSFGLRPTAWANQTAAAGPQAALASSAVSVEALNWLRLVLIAFLSKVGSVSMLRSGMKRPASSPVLLSFCTMR
jgi:hypothetical protein